MDSMEFDPTGDEEENDSYDEDYLTEGRQAEDDAGFVTHNELDDSNDDIDEDATSGVSGVNHGQQALLGASLTIKNAVDDGPPDTPAYLKNWEVGYAKKMEHKEEWPPDPPKFVDGSLCTNENRLHFDTDSRSMCEFRGSASTS